MIITLPTPAGNLLTHLQTQVQALLGDDFVGLYLYGSLALGDFDPDNSDLDFLVATRDQLSQTQTQALRDLHARIATFDTKWARELEGSYIPLAALRRYDPHNAIHPHIDRGSSFTIEQHDYDWVIQRHVLRERGVVVAGPPIHTLIDPIATEALLFAVQKTLFEWWEPMSHDASRFAWRGYVYYAILTMCRILYTLHHGTIVSKPTAAEWAKGLEDGRWRGLIEVALSRPEPLPPTTVSQLQQFIQYTVTTAS